MESFSRSGDSDRAQTGFTTRQPFSGNHVFPLQITNGRSPDWWLQIPPHQALRPQPGPGATHQALHPPSEPDLREAWKDHFNVVFDTTPPQHYNSCVLKVIVFDWDQWNIQKNETKHGVSRLETESAFYDPRYRLFKDVRHSTSHEIRYLLYGRSVENRVLTVGFTIREARIRVITARPASRKERRIYEQEK